MSSPNASQLRIVEPDRSQRVIRFESLDELLLPEHPARLLWEVTSKLDLSQFLVNIKTFHGCPGRSPRSPQTKLVLWLYAISQGIGSAREIARRIETDLAFQWITGGQTVHHSGLSDFRAEQGQAFDTLLSGILGTLIHKGVLSLDLVAQDGLRVRAYASAPSFRSEASLEACRQQAALHVKAVLAQADDPELSRKQKAAREAAALDFQRRVEEAIVVVKELAAKDPSSEKIHRASTTDSEARVMKMPDGGFRPGYNVQFSTAGDPEGGPRTIVGVQVTNVGSDMGSVVPMLEDIQERTGELPKTHLADANHAKHEDIRKASEMGVEVLIAVPERTQQAIDAAGKDAVIQAWQERMETEEAKQTYRARAGLCELTNAHVRGLYGLKQVLVRGLEKVTNHVLLVAITANLMQHVETLLT